MIKAEKVSYSFPDKELYDKISFTIEDGQHCAFIGASGTGKSTLANIIMNPEEYLYDGKLEISENCHIGYVSQFSKVNKPQDVTVFDFLSEKFVQIQNQINEICREMETATEFDELMERYQAVLDSFGAIDGDNYESNITKMLNLAGLSRHKDMLLVQLSGGEFKLLQVIKEMLTAPDLLIMDEPDAFLDFEHLNGLMQLINSHKGTLLVITHNRFLLDHCFNKILHLENKELQEFDGRYLEYNVALLQMKIEKQELAAADTEEIERNEKLVEQLRKEATMFTSATRGRALHARVSFLERLKAKRMKEPFVELKKPEIHFETGKQIEEGIVLEVKDYSVSFDEMVLEHVNFEIGAKDKVALIGPNGTGKTTLLRDIFKHASESVQIRENTEVGFASQLQGECLNEANTILDEFLAMGFATNQDVQKHLVKFGFEEEELYQRIRALSGGEKNLLQLAKISASNTQLLLLDEPASHMDMYSQVALEKAMNEYEGAILMVSHDFYAIANCMDYVLLIEDKTVRRMSIRKFRKMIYANYFDKEYLEIAQKKKNAEMKVELALEKRDYEKAKVLAEELEAIIKKM